MQFARIRSSVAAVLLIAGWNLALSEPAAAQNPVLLPGTSRLDVLSSILADRGNVVLPIDGYKLDGFERDLLSEYRTDSVKRTGDSGKVVATVNVAGEFYPAVILHDSGGREPLALLVDGVERGRTNADWDDNRQRLFFLPERVSFRAGGTLELRALGRDGLYRVETLLLLKEKPEVAKREYSISRLEAGEGGSVTWITNWPVAATVEWAADGLPGGKSAELLAVNNHRVRLQGLRPVTDYRVRISAPTPDSGMVTSPWVNAERKPAQAAAGTVRKATVSLRVGDPVQGQAATGAPVTSGVPFPKGMLANDDNLRLLDASSREVPLQARTLGRWDDDSVKWALLDFAGASGAAYTLEYGAEVRRTSAPSALKVVEDKEAVEVVTGPLKLRVSKSQYGVPGAVWLDSNADGRFEPDEAIVSSRAPGTLVITDAAGTQHTSFGPPDEVAVEERGPVRVTIRVSGGHRGPSGRKLFGYTVRIHAWAEKPFLRIQHTFTNDSEAAEFTSFRSLSLRLPLVSSIGGTNRHWWTFGPPAGQLQPLRAGQSLTLTQHRDNHFSIADGGRTLAEGRRAEGTAGWSDGLRSVTLAVRDFWQNYPKDLSVSADGFDLGLCPPLRSDEYADAKGTVDEHRLYYYMQGGGYKLRQGVSKTHDVWLGFNGAEGTQKEPPALRRPPLSPLRASAPADWYAGSKAFGELAPRKATGVLAQYDGAFDRSFAAYLANREINREYGMLNFGDWWGEREINWGNSEYDTQHSFFLQFARTGDWRYFLAGEEMEWHNRDVDTIHHHANESRVGGVYLHCVGHTGDYYEKSPVQGKGIPQGGMIVSHTFIEGHLEYYFLTGELRSLETARQIADRFDAYETRNYDFTNCRNPGWHLILTMAMYNASYDPYYLNAARIIVERVLERQTPEGGWKRQLVPGHCTCLPRHHGNAGFMVAILMTGMKHYYRATGDERVAKSIVRASHFLIDDMWMPDVQGFRYTSCPRSSKGAWSNFLLFDGITFAHQRTGEEKLGDILKRGIGSALQNMTGWGKGFTQYTRVAPGFLGYLADLQKD